MAGPSVPRYSEITKTLREGSNPMSTILRTLNAEKYYGGKNNLTRALADVSFEVETGEYVGIMGASGSGKTTLLKCISTPSTASRLGAEINGLKFVFSLPALGSILPLIVGLGAAGTFLFFFSLSGFFLKLLKQNKKLYLNGLNMFILRQINSKINTAYVSITLNKRGLIR
jgi:hypothetical protein